MHGLKIQSGHLPRSLLTATLVCGLVFAIGPAIAQASFVGRGQFGISGSENGQFGSFAPIGPAIDQASGDVYLVDVAANRVEKFDSTGSYLAQFGSAGSGDGQFQHAGGIAVDPSNGDVYVFDQGGARVEKFDSSGNFLRAFGWGVADGNAAAESCTSSCQAGIPGAGSGQFAGGLTSLANVLAVDSAGNVYVADPANARVEKFDSAGNYLAQITTNLVSPEGLAIDAANNLYVADPGTENGGAVERFDSSGNLVSSIAAGTGPTAVASDPAGDLFVYANDIGPHIVEYDSSAAQIDDFGFGSLGSYAIVKPGIAFGNGAGVLYVADPGNSRAVIFGTAVPAPDVVTGPASNVQATSATLNGTVNPNGAQVTSCQFDYGTSTSYGKSAPCAQDPGSGNTANPVAADVASLQPNTTYHFRLRAGNANFLSTRTGQDQSFTTPGPPTVDSVSVADVTSAEAILKAQVNPENADTTYHFEYGTSAAYGTSAPVPDGDLGAGSGDQPASTPISGLNPGTTYHFRLVARNAEGTTNGSDQTFTTFAPPEAGLPDGRAYELVTPVNKLGNDIGLPEDPGFESGVSVDGQRVIYSSTGAFGDPPNGLGGDYVATRTSDGWVTTPATLPPGTDHPNTENVPSLDGVTPDFYTLFFDTANAIDPNDQNVSLDVYAFHVADRAISWISQDGTVQTAHGPSRYVGSSADGNHVLFGTTKRLTATDSGQLAGLGLYDRTAGHTRLIGVNSDGSLTSVCGATLGNVQIIVNEVGLGGESVPLRANAVSADGSMIYFESPDPAGKGDPSCSPAQGGTQPVELYLRANASTTTEISLSQKTGSVGAPAHGGAIFQGATPDGSRVFFTSTDPLTNDPLAAAGGLYRYDSRSGTLTLIAPTSSSRVYTDSLRDPMISSDGNQVYFIGSVPGNGPAGNNLYVWNRGQIQFIAPEPSASATPPEARLSGDGLTFAFTAANNPTGFDSHGFYEVYVYRATTGVLSCISCDPNRGTPTGDATFFGDGHFASNLVSQNVSSDGSRVFFASPDRLLPQATNDLYNIYEYEGGALHLLNDGNSPYQSWLVGASADGRDVIFATNAALVPQDRDGGADFYDARIGGGFPTSSPPVPCQGDACQGALAATPAMPSPGSIVFSGPGNASPGAGPVVARVRVTKTTISGSTFKLTVIVPDKGLITGSGSRLRGVKRPVGKAGTYTLTFTLTAQAKRTLRRRLKLPVIARVGYTPSNGTTSSATVSLTLVQAKAHKAGQAAGSTPRAGK
jgi:hypothetical protein